MLKIAPSLLAADFSRLAHEVEDVARGGADMLHLDVMDGHFVPNLTFGPPVVASVNARCDLTLDCHLMVTDPLQWIEPFVRAGADLISFHVEANGDPAALADAILAAGARPALALNPDTTLYRVRPILDRFDMILVMSVFPGFGGQRFMPEVLPKIRELRDLGFENDIQVDGGIDRETAPLVVEAGANVLVAGSAIFRHEDRAKAIADIRTAGSARSLTAES